MAFEPQQDSAPTPAPRYFFIFKSSTGALLCFYLLLMLIGIVMAWLHLLGILPVLILCTSIFGLLHAAYRMVLSDDEDYIDELHQERGGKCKKVVFFVDN